MIEHKDLKFSGYEYDRIVKKTNGLLYTKYINRPLAWMFTRFLYKKCTPNTVSFLAFLMLFSGLTFFSSRGEYEFTDALVLFLVAFLNYILDSCDGQIARLTGKGSSLGEWLDHSLDALRLLLVNIFIIAFIIQSGIDYINIYLIFLSLFSQVGLYVVGTLRQKVLKKDYSKKVRDGKAGNLITALLSPLDYGVFIFLFLLLSSPQTLMYSYIVLGLYGFCILILMMLYIFISSKMEH